MTPPKQSSSANQPSISSYFSKPPQKRPRDVVPDPPQAEDDVVDLTESPVPKRSRRTQSNDVDIVDLESPPPPSGEVSSFFKTKATTTGFTIAELASAAVKRGKAIASALEHPARTALNRFKAPETSVVKVIRSGKAFDDFGLGSTQADAIEYGHGNRVESSTQAATLSQQSQSSRRRHEEWQRRTTSLHGLVPRRRSLTLDEAAGRASVKLASGEDLSDEEPVADEEVEIIAPPSKAKKSAAKGKKKQEEVGPSGMPYTPLEKQFMEIKAKNEDVLLLTEVGYKFKFHGDDAKIASKELGIACFPQRNFFVASIPTHRLHIHVKKLVAQGHKVGVVRQTETAALKAVGENRNQPFKRELTSLYTAATYVDDSSTIDDVMPDHSLQMSSAPPSFVCFTETNMGGMGADERVRVHMIGVIVQTGEVVYDEFEAGHLRTELDTRLMHLAPSEILLPTRALSKPTEKMVKYFVDNSRSTSGAGVRLERSPFAANYDKAFEYVSRHYRSRQGRGKDVEIIELDDEDDFFAEGQIVGSKKAPDDVTKNDEQDAIGGLADLSKQLCIVLAASINHLDRFSLADALLHINSFAKFSARAHMILSADTLVNLEIYCNSTDLSERGSLFWLLDHAKTKMGKRLLREWLGRPLTDAKALQGRSEAVSEILSTNTVTLSKLQGLLKNMPDLQRGLCRIQYHKASSDEVVTLLSALNRLASEFSGFEPGSGAISSRLLKDIIESLPKLQEPVRELLAAIDSREAHAGKLANMFLDPHKFPTIQDAKDCIGMCSHELEELLVTIRKRLRKPTLQFVTVAGIDFLIEVRLKEAVPDEWVKISSTKFVARYHTPEVISRMKELEQGKEQLQAESAAAFRMWQDEISEHYALFRDAVSKLAIFDCLQSLAIVAASPGYVKPDYVAEACLRIKGCRHPMAEIMRDDVYVPNDVMFGSENNKVMVITGPNMAGKSSYVRAVALTLVMAQIGSYVPADKAEIGLHDAIFTRMGASDDLGRGQSTFMVELSEMSEILRKASPRSLVICDELGRGTSTHDGTAIAYGVLDRLVEMRCHTMFITHFPNVAADVVKKSPDLVGMFHMSFEESQAKDGSAEITFTYHMIPGIAHRSFGVWVAKLAGLPSDVLTIASDKSEAMRRRAHVAIVRRAIQAKDDEDPSRILARIKGLLAT